MPYPAATGKDIDFFGAHGYLVVKHAVDLADLDVLVDLREQIIENKQLMAFDWAWSADKSREEREFTILQSSPSFIWPDLFASAPFRLWAVGFGSALMGRPVEFWYDQFLAKPPRKGGRTYWHQDEGYWGRNLADRGITCWMPFHDVEVANGCMHFIDGGHLDGILEHRRVEGVQSDLLQCEPDQARCVAAPVRGGSVTFHHSKTPHMTSPNETDRWRKILTQHLRVAGSPGEGQHYPWKVTVDQRPEELLAADARTAAQ